MVAEALLVSWRDTPARKAITDFVPGSPRRVRLAISRLPTTGAIKLHIELGRVLLGASQFRLATNPARARPSSWTSTRPAHPGTCPQRQQSVAPLPVHKPMRKSVNWPADVRTSRRARRALLPLTRQPPSRGAVNATTRQAPSSETMMTFDNDLCRRGNRQGSDKERGLVAALPHVWDASHRASLPAVRQLVVLRGESHGTRIGSTSSAVSNNVGSLGERVGDPPIWLPALEPEPEFWRRARCGRSCR